MIMMKYYTLQLELIMPKFSSAIYLVGPIQLSNRMTKSFPKSNPDMVTGPDSSLQLCPTFFKWGGGTQFFTGKRSLLSPPLNQPPRQKFVFLIPSFMGLTIKKNIKRSYKTLTMPGRNWLGLVDILLDTQCSGQGRVEDTGWFQQDTDTRWAGVVAQEGRN